MRENYLSKITMDIIRTLTTQSDVKLSSLKYLSQFEAHFIEIIILVFSWLMFTNIMTKCFTSLLLNSYFTQKSIPLVNNLEDVLDNELPIAAKDNTFDFMEHFHMISEEQVNISRQLRDEYQDNFDFKFDKYLAILNKLIFNDVVNGWAVILLNGFEREAFEAQYISESKKFMVLDKKYISNFAAHFIPKNNTHLGEIKFA